MITGGKRSRTPAGGAPLVLGNESNMRVDSVSLPLRGLGAQRSSAHALSLGGNSLLVAILSPFLALTSETAQRILLAVVIFDIPLQFGTHLFYREDDAALGALGGLSISATTLALAGLYLSWLIRAFASRNSGPRTGVNVNWPLVAYFGITLLSVFVAQDISLSLFELCLLFEACLVYFYIAGNVQTKEDVIFVVSILLAACVVESVVMIILRFTGMSSTIWGLPTHIHIDNDPKKGFMRIGGTVGSPNFAAAYISISLSCAASVLFTNLGRLYKWLATTALGLGSIALILTFSRGGWLALVLSLALLCLVTWRRRGLSLKAPIAVLVLLVLLYVPFHSLIGARLFGDDRGSAESRIPLMNLAFRITEDHPLLGVGANNFTVAMGPYLTSEFREVFLFAVHNKYLLVLAETGIGGLLAFMAFFAGTVRKGWQCWNLRDHLLSPLALGFAAGIAGHMVHMTVDVFRGRPTQQLVWLIAGLLVAMCRIAATPADQDSLASAT
jgi:putative inorganic carbon (hco3(-)) transporter